MNKLTRKIWFDENSQPPKDHIWYRQGAFYSYVDKKWKKIHDLTEVNYYTGDSIDEIENPKEGNIFIKSSYQETFNPEASTFFDVSKYNSINIEYISENIEDYFSAYDENNNLLFYASVFSTEFPKTINTENISKIIFYGPVEAFKFTGLVPDTPYEYINGEWVERKNLNDTVESLVEESKTHQSVVSLSAMGRFSNGYVYNDGYGYNYPNGTIVTFYSEFKDLNEQTTNIGTNDVWILSKKYPGNLFQSTPISNFSSIVLKGYSTDMAVINVVQHEYVSPYGGGTSMKNYIQVSYTYTNGPSYDPSSIPNFELINPEALLGETGFKMSGNDHSIYSGNYYSIIEVFPENVDNPIKLSDYIRVVYGNPTDGKFYEVFNHYLVERGIQERKVSELVYNISLDAINNPNTDWDSLFNNAVYGNIYGVTISDPSIYFNSFYTIISAVNNGDGTGEVKFGPYTLTMNSWIYTMTKSE